MDSSLSEYLLEIESEAKKNDEIVKDESDNLAVHIESACKAYGKFQVLKNLELQVPRGAIYGLLGPSGCGKTTILRSIVGRIDIDSGRISVLGKEPCSKGHGIPGPLVGYMPQEIALYNEFTTAEILIYFGFLHNMKLEQIRKRTEFLVDFLDLPSKDKLIKNLSGGQKRRVSMTVALLQEPQLLILDEPTVGVDPLLREKIWDHLIMISKSSHTTIIITTHYIEEARKADRVGLMRNGRILAEDSPDNLIKTHNESSLENVFLKLCLKDKSPEAIESGIINPTFSSDQNKNHKAENTPVVDFAAPDNENLSKKKNICSKFMKHFGQSFRLPKGHNFLSILYKNSILMRRNIGFLMFQFLIPVIQISLFCLCIGREPYNLKFGVVNNETLQNSSETNASLLFLSFLNQDSSTFSQVKLNWSEAYRKTKNNELWGFVDLSANFTQDTKAKFTTPFIDSNFTGSNVNLYLDASNQQITLTIQARLTQAYQKFLVDYVTSLTDVIFKINPVLLQSPVIMHQPIYGQLNPQFINYMAPGIMITIMFTLTIGLTALMFVTEKKEGLFDRSWIAGTSTIEVMLAHVTAKILIMLVQITFLLIISGLVFQVKMEGPIWTAALLLLLQGFCGMSYGLALSATTDDETSVIQVAIGSVFPVLLLSGIIWPLEGMPNWVRFISNFSPLTQTAEAMRSIASRGWNFSHYSVWFGTLTGILWSLLFNVVALVVSSFNE